MTRFFSALIVAMSVAVPALAQCSMCRTAAAQNAQAAKTINTAILILLLPALALFSSVFLLALRSSDAESEDDRK
jgi:hypothetical protein